MNVMESIVWNNLKEIWKNETNIEMNENDNK